MLRAKQLTRTATVPISGGLLVEKDRYFSALEAFRGGDAAPIIDQFTHASLRAVHHGRQLASTLTELRYSWRNTIRTRSDSAVWQIIDLLPAHPSAAYFHRASKLNRSTASRSDSPSRVGLRLSGGRAHGGWSTCGPGWPARRKLRRFSHAIAAGASPGALVGAMNEAQGELTAARAELALLEPTGSATPRERIEQMFQAMGTQVREVFSEERSQHLLRDFYRAIGLRASLASQRATTASRAGDGEDARLHRG